MRRVLAALLFAWVIVVVSAGVHVALLGPRSAESASAAASSAPIGTPQPHKSGAPEAAEAGVAGATGAVLAAAPPKGLSPDQAGREQSPSPGERSVPQKKEPEPKPIPRMSALVPILMYHNVRPIDFSATNAFVSSLTLPPTEFERQLRYLKERGFKSVTLKDVAEYLRGGRDLPPRAVVLTFDDGFENNRLYAYPLLNSLGFTGTFFIITGLVGRTEYMSWKQVSELRAGGMEIGSHTVSHPDLPASSPAARERELVTSKETLERNLGVTVTALSYPSGSYNADVVEVAKRAGYETAVTTRYGAVLQGDRPMELPRVRIQGTDTLPTFRWRIEQYFPPGDPVTK